MSWNGGRFTVGQTGGWVVVIVVAALMLVLIKRFFEWQFHSVHHSFQMQVEYAGADVYPRQKQRCYSRAHQPTASAPELN